MSEPIIIETPQPPVRERITVTRLPDALGGPSTRDAEPADLERAGWVRVETAARLRSDLVEMQREDEEARSALGVEYPAEPTTTAARRVARERDEAREQRDNYRANYGNACVERDEVRLILDAIAGETIADAATRLHNDWVDARERADRVERERAVDALSERAKLATAERERDEAREALATWRGSAEQERARCVAYLRAEAERARHMLPESGRNEPWPHAEAVGAHLDIAADRIERGDHAGTPVPAACLVTRAVEANVDIRVCEDNGGGFMVGVHAPGCDEDLARCVPAADVTKELARLLDEVTR